MTAIKAILKIIQEEIIMAKCGICGNNGNCRMIEKIYFCKDCFENLQKVRGHDIEAIEYFANPANYPFATDEGKKYMLHQAEMNIGLVYEVRAEYEKAKAHGKELEKIILTTTNNLEGYKISKYLGVLCAEIVMPNGVFGEVAEGTFYTIQALDKARKRAFDVLKEKAYNTNADAVVAIDIDISDLNGKGVMVSVNGTAVKLEA
jgi:uncharacterized protein YbjQ (UPF0145 family)